jgi:hypothetical protein
MEGGGIKPENLRLFGGENGAGLSGSSALFAGDTCVWQAPFSWIFLAGAFAKRSGGDGNLSQFNPIFFATLFRPTQTFAIF